MSDATLVLNRAEPGDPQAASKLLPLVYDELSLPTLALRFLHTFRFSADGHTVGSQSALDLLHLWHAPSFEEIEAKERAEATSAGLKR